MRYVQQVTHQPLATIYHAPSAPLWVSWLWLVAQIYIENIFVYLEHIQNIVCDHLSSLMILNVWQQDNYLSLTLSWFSTIKEQRIKEKILFSQKIAENVIDIYNHYTAQMAFVVQLFPNIF